METYGYRYKGSGPEDHKAYCSLCGAPFYRSQGFRDEDGLLICPVHHDHQSVTRLTALNQAAGEAHLQGLEVQRLDDEEFVDP